MMKRHSDSGATELVNADSPVPERAVGGCAAKLFGILWAAALSAMAGSSPADIGTFHKDLVTVPPFERTYRYRLPEPFGEMALRVATASDRYGTVKIEAIGLDFGHQRLSMDRAFLGDLVVWDPSISFQKAHLDEFGELKRFDIVLPHTPRGGGRMKLYVDFPVPWDEGQFHRWESGWTAFTVDRAGRVARVMMSGSLTLPGWGVRGERSVRHVDVPFFMPIELPDVPGFDPHESFPGFQVVEPFSQVVKVKLSEPFGVVTVHLRGVPHGRLEAAEVEIRHLPAFAVDAEHLREVGNLDFAGFSYKHKDVDEYGALKKFTLAFAYGPMVEKGYYWGYVDWGRTFVNVIMDWKGVVDVERLDLSWLCPPRLADIRDFCRPLSRGGSP